MKKAIKRILALGAGATMVGATIMGAMALTLADYPEPFVVNGEWDGAIVVGAHAATSDVLGAIDIASSLQAVAYSEEGVSIDTGAISVVGGKDYDQQVLNGAWTGVNLSESKLEGYRDTTTDFDDSDIDYHDELILNSGAVEFDTSRIEEDFGDAIYMVTDAEAIKYRVYFDDEIDVSQVGKTSTTDELEFYFLGKLLTVTAVGDNNDSITVEASSDYYMQEGDVLTIGSHEVTLVKVGGGVVRIDVDGQILVIEDDETVTFDEAGDFEVKVESVFYIEGDSENGASVKLGDSLSDSADTGDSVELFGEPKDEDEADWLWDIDMTEGTDQYIGIVNNIDRTDLDFDSAEERPAIALGEALDLPNGYGGLQFAELEEKGDYELLKIDYDDKKDLNDGSSTTRVDLPGLAFSLGGDDYFEVNGIDTNEVFVVWNVSEMEIWYEDGDDEAFAGLAVDDFLIKIDDDEITVTPPTGDLDADLSVDILALDDATNLSLYAWNMAFETVDDVYFYIDVDFDYFGFVDDDEAEELKYADGAIAGIGTQDYDYVTDYGAIIEDPESQLGSGSSLEILLPTNQQKATVVVAGPNTVVAGVTGDTTSQTVNPIAVGMAKLDSATTLGEGNLIVVGGPNANTIAMELMGNPVNPLEFFEQGKAHITLYEDYNAILVAGYEAEETLGACYVLADYDEYTLTGTEVEVVVASLANIQVNPVTS